MPPWIIAALPVVLATIAAVVTGVLLVGPFVLPIWLKTLKRLDRERLLAATKGAFLVVSEIAKRTPTTLDDDVAKIIKMVEDETGKSLAGESRKVVEGASRAMNADPRLPSLSPPSGHPFGVRT